MERFALRHKATGHYMPELKGRGYSHWTPTVADPSGGIESAIKGSVRLFMTAQGASNARVLWAQGVFERGYTAPSSMFGDPGGDDWVKPRDVGRKKDELEIVVFTLVIGDPHALLTKYMAHVLDCEGATFVENHRHSDIKFTPEEQATLERIEPFAAQLFQKGTST